MRYVWNRQDARLDRKRIEELHRGLSSGPLRIPFSFTALLLSRGFDTPERIWQVLNRKTKWGTGDFSDPFLLPDMRKAVQRIFQAIEKKEPVLLFGDYDADGITSLAILFSFFKTYFPEVIVSLFQPSRFSEGYGFGNEGVDTAAATGARLIITVDCGVTSVEPVKYASDKGIDVIITDHHEPGGTLPQALAVVDPKRSDQPAGFRDFAGCGVAFKLVLAMVLEKPEKFPDFKLAPYLELAAIGSVADIVPLVDENRMIVQAGLAILNTRIQGHKGINDGILAIREKARILDQKLTSYHLGFVIGPRLNAASRIEEARSATELLVSGDLKEIARLAANLENLNARRKSIQKELQERAEKKIADDPETRRHSIIVFSDTEADEGVRGIVASRIASVYSRPVIVFSIDTEAQTATGSARSITGFDLHEALHRLDRYFLRWGGHKGAAGMTVALDKLTEFKDEAFKLFDSLLPPDRLRPSVDIESAVLPAELDTNFADLLSRLEPFGNGNPEPKFLLENMRILKTIIKQGNGGISDRMIVDVISKDETTFHSLTLWDPAPLLGKETAESWPGRFADFVVCISANDWNGRTYLNLKVIDLEFRK
jgi:single-stranded-DNA-specific exonuclease